MKQSVKFTGTVNGKTFHSREAMNNYMADLEKNGVAINEYTITEETSFSIESKKVANNTVVLEDAPQEAIPVAPKPYKSLMEYIIPTIGEVNDTVSKVCEDPDALERIDKNLRDRMEKFVELETCDNKHVDEALDELRVRASETGKYCDSLAEGYTNRIEDLHNQMINIQTELERCERVQEFLDDLGSYASVIEDSCNDR